MRSAVVVVTVLLAAVAARATPLYSVMAGHSCRGCHIEPSGWRNPPDAERACTLSCKGCHVSPGGGGMRTPAGRYFGLEELPTWGFRPSAHVDTAKYRPEGHPAEGRYRLWTGPSLDEDDPPLERFFGAVDAWEGWWPGDIPHERVADRYGFIDPRPLVDVGTDLRALALAELDAGGALDLAAFPMQAELYATLRPVRDVAFVGSLGLRGDDAGGVTEHGLGAYAMRARALDWLTVRELYAMVDGLPLGGHVRAGRFPLIYGWRIADHTAFVRQELGFDQDRSVFGVEGGVVMNYAYAHLQAFRQGGTLWPGDAPLLATSTSLSRRDEAGNPGLVAGKGVATSFGWRALGWQLGASMVGFDGEGRAPDSFTTGLTWAVNLYPVAYLGELDWQRTRLSSGVASRNKSGLFALHEVDWLIYRGVYGKVRYDWRDVDVSFKDDPPHRATLGLEWHPFMLTHLELDYRYQWRGYDFAGSASHQALLLVHVWY